MPKIDLIQADSRRIPLADFELFQGDCLDLMSGMSDGSVDASITSPPYDDLREYEGIAPWSFDVFKSVAIELFRVLKPGGVIVWVVNDQTVKGSESGHSFRQALYFMDLGLRLHDTMLYSAPGLTMNHNRYEQEFEYMFIFSKGRPEVFNPIMVNTKWYGKDGDRTGQTTKEHGEKLKKLRSAKKRTTVKKTKIKGNIWTYSTGKNNTTMDHYAFDHPAMFPEALAKDHIISWTDPGQLILDPFMGAGTTGKCCAQLNRRFIGSEIVPKYFAIAERRIKTAYAQKVMF